jgi:hypothetical protein
MPRTFRGSREEQEEEQRCRKALEDKQRDNMEADILSGVNSGVRKVWAKYCLHPEEDIDLLQLCKGA